MKFLSIKESGANNILMWAISNGADIKSDLALQSVINDELSYIMIIDDVNYFELFRLTQIYRDKIYIIESKEVEIPNRKELHETFNGIYKPDPNDPAKDVELCELVEHCCNMFINIVMQMTNDDHIIDPNIVAMFLPMLSQRFTVQIPVSFSDIINSMSVDESNKIYNHNYPETLNIISDSESHGVKIRFQIAMLKSTSIIKYNPQYDQYLKILKYGPLKTCNNNKLYKIAMLGFSKYNKFTKSENRVDLFNLNKDSMQTTLNNMAHSAGTPLELEFAIQLPILYMQILENSYSNEVLPIAYESSMSNIIDSGLSCEDFVVSRYKYDSSNTPGDKIEEYNNAINSYRMRLTEANQIMLNAMPILLNSDGNVHITSVFAMMPTAYTTRAVIKVNIDNIDKLTSHYNPIIAEMFNDIKDIASSVITDIKGAI